MYMCVRFLSDVLDSFFFCCCCWKCIAISRVIFFLALPRLGLETLTELFLGNWRRVLNFTLGFMRDEVFCFLSVEDLGIDLSTQTFLFFFPKKHVLLYSSPFGDLMNSQLESFRISGVFKHWQFPLPLKWNLSGALHIITLIGSPSTRTP